MPDYTSIQELVSLATQLQKSLGQLVLEEQAAQLDMTPEALLQIIDQRLAVMEKAAESGMQPTTRSTSGLTGGDGWRMHTYEEKALSGAFCAKAVAIALSVAEHNAAMGRIVASPTAGSCGILPGALLPMMSEYGATREEVCLALLCAGGIGLVIAQQATIAGAEGGCQAECGAAAAMAAAALVQLRGGSPAQCAHAVAIALKNQLGLVCDPVAGLVEVPCIKRNAAGVMCAITAADMALAGITSVIPADEVVVAMGEVGAALPCSLRETAQGGLAATPTGLRLAEEIFGRKK